MNRWSGIRWEAGSDYALVVAPNGLEQLEEFGAALPSAPVRPAFVGVNSTRLGADFARIANGIASFRQSFLTGTSASFRRFAEPRTLTSNKAVVCPTVPACVVLGDQIPNKALVTLSEVGAFVIDQSSLQGKDLLSFDHVYRSFFSHVNFPDPVLPPLGRKKLSDEEYASLTGYPAGVKSTDLQEELDRENKKL